MTSDRKKVEKILDFLDIQCNITDIKRLGKFSNEKTTPRALLVEVDNAWSRRRILASLGKLKNFKLEDKSIFISPDLSPVEQKLENDALIKRRELINANVDRNSLRIRDFKLQQKINGSWNNVAY